MTFGNEWGWGAVPETSERLLNLYADAGGNFIDTANVYTGWRLRKDRRASAAGAA
ncbi:aldo/keto reductase [Streptomyces collinus]